MKYNLLSILGSFQFCHIRNWYVHVQVSVNHCFRYCTDYGAKFMIDTWYIRFNRDELESGLMRF